MLDIARTTTLVLPDIYPMIQFTMSRLIVPKLHNSWDELLTTTFHSLITPRIQFGTTWSELPYCWASSGDYPWCRSSLHIHHPKASDQWHGMGFLLMKPPSSVMWLLSTPSPPRPSQTQWSNLPSVHRGEYWLAWGLYGWLGKSLVEVLPAGGNVLWATKREL